MATHVRARESKGTACVVVVSGMRFEIFFFFLHVRPRTSIENVWCRFNFELTRKDKKGNLVQDYSYSHHGHRQDHEYWIIVFVCAI